MSNIVPELDVSARRFNIRMTEGDPIEFIWLVPGFAAWAGTYVFKVDPGAVVLTIGNTVVAQGLDVLFTVSGAAQPTLVKNSSGYPWDMQKVGSLTRFAGLLFVDSEVL